MDIINTIERIDTAVELLSHHRLQEASYAFAALAGICASACRHLDDGAVSDTSEKGRLTTRCLTLETISCDRSEISSWCSNLSDESPLRMYSKAIRIHQEANTELTNALELQALVSVIVLYNLGLTYHYMACTSIQDQNRNLKKALRIYELAFGIQQNEETHLEIPGGYIVSLALINNIACIHSYFCDEGYISDFMEMLKTYICHANDAMGGYLHCDLGDFFLNVIMYNENKINYAASA